MGRRRRRRRLAGLAISPGGKLSMYYVLRLVHLYSMSPAPLSPLTRLPPGLPAVHPHRPGTVHPRPLPTLSVFTSTSRLGNGRRPVEGRHRRLHRWDARAPYHLSVPSVFRRGAGVWGTMEVIHTTTYESTLAPGLSHLNVILSRRSRRMVSVPISSFSSSHLYRLPFRSTTSSDLASIPCVQSHRAGPDKT